MEDILYLEPDEEITSVIDKLRGSKAKELRLVVPRGATLLQSVINLKLLAKEASSIGKVIAIVTADKIGRNLAAQVGLTVFDSIKNQKPIFEPVRPEVSSQEVLEIDERKIEPMPVPPGLSVHHFQGVPAVKQTEPPKIDHEKFEAPQASFPLTKKLKIRQPFNWRLFKKIGLPVMIGLVLILLATSYFVLPEVKVNIKVLSDPFEKTQDIVINGDSSSTDPNFYPGTFVEVSRDKAGKFTTTGQKNLGGKATGTITLYNKKGSSKNFAAGTKLSSSSQTFLLKAAVTVPGATVSDMGTVNPGTAGANIEAENPGEQYNIKAGTFVIVDLAAADQNLIYGQSSKDMTGGFSKQVQVVSQEDFDKAKTQLTGELSDDITQEIKNEIADLETIDKSVVIEQTNSQSTANVGDQATDFTLHLYLRGRVVALKTDGFQAFVLDQASKELSADKMISLGPGDSVAPAVKAASYDKKQLILAVAITGEVSSRLDSGQIQSDLLGKNKAQASGYLASLSGTNGADIVYKPAWWPIKKIPRFNKFVKVEFEYISTNNRGTENPQ